MERYFDGHLYFANWGTRILELALPQDVLPLKTADLYCRTESVSARANSGRIILYLCSEDEGTGEFEEFDGALSALLHLRTDLARGDLRCLYLAWLIGVQSGELAPDELEPAVPPNLAEISGALSAFVHFLRINPDLIAVAAQSSPSVETRRAAEKEMADWVASLPAQEKDKALVRLMSGKDPHIGPTLLARFERSRKTSVPVAQKPRTVGQLRAAAELES
jgi:hypothetical protein